MNPEKTLSALKTWLNETIPDGHDLIVPISGGSDSALCFLLCASVARDRVLGVYIGTNLRQKEWFESIGTVHYGDTKVSTANPEVDRWAYFLSLALSQNRILVGSRNLTESILGTYSTASKVASYFPLGKLWKHEIMELCAYAGIPEEIIKSSSRADPECGRPANLADIPFKSVDAFLQEKLSGSAEQYEAVLSAEQRQFLNEVYARNSYKASLPLSGPQAVDIET